METLPDIKQNLIKENMLPTVVVLGITSNFHGRLFVHFSER